VTLVFRQLEVRFLASSMAGSPNHRKHLLKPPLPKQDTGSPRRQILSDSGMLRGKQNLGCVKSGDRRRSGNRCPDIRPAWRQPLYA